MSVPSVTSIFLLKKTGTFLTPGLENRRSYQFRLGNIFCSAVRNPYTGETDRQARRLMRHADNYTRNAAFAREGRL